MGNSVIGAVIGGIIATFIGIFVHYFVGDRKVKKRLCQALCEELNYNTERLRTSVSLRGGEYSVPHFFITNGYLEARNYGVLRGLPKEIRNPIEEYYSFLQFLGAYRFGYVATGNLTIDSYVKNPTETEVAKKMDAVLPQLEEFCSNLRVYPHDDVACIVRRIKRAG